MSAHQQISRGHVEDHVRRRARRARRVEGHGGRLAGVRGAERHGRHRTASDDQAGFNGDGEKGSMDLFLKWWSMKNDALIPPQGESFWSRFKAGSDCSVELHTKYK